MFMILNYDYTKKTSSVCAHPFDNPLAKAFLFGAPFRTLRTTKDALLDTLVTDDTFPLPRAFRVYARCYPGAEIET